MKKIFYTLSLLFIGINLVAQVPNKMSYQTIVRNNNNQLVNNQQVGIKISLLQGSTTGTVVFSQTFTPTTNANGLATLVIGDTSNAYANISWAIGSPYFIKTEVDPTGGTNYTIEATSELMSVPYAMVAGYTANTGKSSIHIYDDQNVITNTEAEEIIAEDGGLTTQDIDIENGIVFNKVDLNKIKLPKRLNSLVVYPNFPIGSQFYQVLDTFLCDNIETISGGGTTGILKVKAKHISMKALKKCRSILASGVSSNSFPNLETATSTTLYGTDLNFPKLTKSGNAIISGTNLSFPLLTSNIINNYVITGNNYNFPRIDSLNELTLRGYNVSMSNLKYANKIRFEGEPFNSLSLPLLSRFDGTLELAFYGQSNKAFTLSAFEYINVLSIFDYTDTALQFPNLDSIGSSINDNLFAAGVLKTISFDSLKYCGGMLQIHEKSSLVDVQINKLITCPQIFIKNNPKLVNIDISSLKNANFIDLSFNNFSSNTVNKILHQLLSLNGNFGNIQLQGQKSSAPPTGQGVLDKQALIAKGYYVTTD